MRLAELDDELVNSGRLGRLSGQLAHLRQPTSGDPVTETSPAYTRRVTLGFACGCRSPPRRRRFEGRPATGAHTGAPAGNRHEAAVGPVESASRPATGRPKRNFQRPQAEPLRDMRLSPRHCLQHLPLTTHRMDPTPDESTSTTTPSVLTRGTNNHAPTPKARSCRPGHSASHTSWPRGHPRRSSVRP